MSQYRCLVDPNHNSFRIEALATSRLIYFTDRDGKVRFEETSLLEGECVENASCAECGGAVAVTPDV